MPHPGVRAGVHPAVQPSAAPPQPREPDRAPQEPALPLQHLRQGLRHREQPQNSHRKGKRVIYFPERWLISRRFPNCEQNKVDLFSLSTSRYAS